MTATNPSQTLTVLLLSDSTGETVRAAVRAVLSQFAGIELKYHLQPFIRSEQDLRALPPEFLRHADIIVFTLVDPAMKAQTLALAEAHGIPAIPLLDPLFTGMQKVLRQDPSGRPGQQYLVNNTYLDRISAIDFAISHDDGLSEDYLLGADVILVGVSRTSKTPTCIYLAYQGIKAANVPLVLATPPPARLLKAMEAGIPTIGLTASPARLVQVRQTRLSALGSTRIDGYSERGHVEEELVAAQLFFERHQLPVIDVTRRSIEETAASIRHILSGRT